MADIEKWITINGAHIPIIKGESKARAVANFIKSKRNKDKATLTKMLSKTRKELKQNARSKALDRYSAELTAKQLLKNTRPEIKGRRKSAEEIDAMGKRLAATKDIDYNDKNNWISLDNWANQISAKDRYKLKTDKPKNVYKKKQYSDKKSITTPSGYYSPKELHERDAKIQKLYMKAYDQKSNYTFTNLQRDLDKLVKTGKVTRGELSSIQYTASGTYDRLKARNKKVSLKGVKTKRK